MKRRYTALMLALLMLAQVFAPEVARAKSSEPSKKSTVQLVKMGALDPKTYPKLDNKAILAIQKQARNNQNRSRTGSSGFFSVGSPYLPGQNPSNDEKAAAYGNLRVDFVTEGLNDNGVIKPFQWNEIFGTDSNGNPGTANIYFVQRDAKTNQKINTFKLTVDKAGKYSLNDLYGKPAKLPLYSEALEPYKYEAELEIGISEKVTLLTFKLSETGSEQPSYTTDSEGKLVADIPLYLKIGQTASTKFVSKWNTNVEEANRPKVVGGFNNKTEDDFNYFPFPINDTDVLKIRREQFDLNNDEWPGYMPQLPMQLREVPKVTVDEDMLEDPATYTIDKNTKRITATNGKIYKYDLQYDVINGGKLTMTEMIPVTFDANGGKFASITEEGADQKIVKEVEYGKDLTDMAEKPTKDRETFKGWGIKDGEKIVAAKDADFAKIKEAKTFYAIWGNNDIVAEELTVHESFKDGTGYVNDFIPSLDTLKGQVKIKDAKGDPQALADDDTLQILDDSGNPIADTDLKDKLYEKLKEDDGTEVSRNVTLKAKVTVNGTSQTVDIPIKVVKNIYEAKTEEGKPNYVPKDYVKVTVDPTTKAEKPQKYFYYVNPNAKVVIPGKDPVGTGNNQFTKWLIKGTDTEYKLSEHPRYQFSGETTIEAQYVSDVIPANDDGNKAEGTPDNFVKVTFVPTDKATDTAEKIFYVNPEKEVTIPVKNPVGKQYFTFKEWKIGADAKGDKYVPSTPKKFTEATTITATYDEAKNIISYDPKEPTTRPEGYVRVTFAADPGLKLTEQKAYYVKANAGITLGNTELKKPGYEAQTGYKFEKWDKEDSLVIEATDIVVTAKATKLDNVIPEKDGEDNPNTKPEGYKTVTFVIKDEDKAKGSITGVAKFYVNPTEYVKINPPTTEANTGYVFGSWDKDTTIPTVYDKDTTITGSFNGPKDVIPKTNPDGTENKQPAGYVKVTFVIHPENAGKIVAGESEVYYVIPNKYVTITPPKTSPNVGYKFRAWGTDTMTPTKYTMPNTEVYGNFEKIGDFIPSTDKDGKSNPKPEGYVTVTFTDGKHGTITSGKKVYYVNPNANVNMSDLTFARNSNRPVVTPDVGYDFSHWSKQNDFVIKEDLVVTAMYTAHADVVPKDKPTGGENKQPDGYITVTFKTTDKAGSVEKVVYVNPEKAVALEGYAPKVNPMIGYEFADWDRPIKEKIQYADNDVITAQFNEIGNVSKVEKPGYVKVEFKQGDHGTLTGDVNLWIKPGVKVTIPAPDVNPNIGYKFDKWDKDLTVKLEAKDSPYKITAGYTDRGNIIPQKNTDGSDRPDGYHTVTFKADANGSLSGTTVVYVKPNTEIDLTDTADAITKNPNVGYTADGGTWTPAIKSKQFTTDETYTFTFKELDDVIEVKPGVDKPNGYVTVKVVPTDKATVETGKTYYVNPTKEVTIPFTKPKGRDVAVDASNPKAFKWNFTKWTSDESPTRVWDKDVDTGFKAKFTNDTTVVTAQYEQSITDQGTVIADEITVHESFKDGNKWVNNFINTEATETILKGTLKVNGDALPDGATVQFLDDSGNAIEGDALKAALYDKLQEKNDGNNPSRVETLRAKVTFKNGEVQNVEIPIKVIKNIYKANTDASKPSYVPDGYVKVTVDPTMKAKDPQKYTYYVNPAAKVVIPGKDPVGVGDNKFVKWTIGDTEYKLSERHQFNGETTITAQYVSDVIPQDGDTKPEGVPDNFVKVTFVPTDNGTMEGPKTFWVNPDKAVTIPVKDPVGKQYFAFKEWKMGVNADGAVYNPSTPTKFTDVNGTTITATYTEAKNIILYDPNEPITRPDGYVRVTFAADPGLKLTESKAYYVKKNANITLKTIKDDTTNYGYPGVTADTGYKFNNWDKEDSLVLGDADVVVKALATLLSDTIVKKPGEQKPEGYVEVKFVAGENGTVEEKAYYVNPNKYVTLTPPAAKGNTGYEFGSWSQDATIPTQYTKPLTTITANFNQSKAVVPKIDDQTKKPDGYKTVTFIIEGKGGSIVDGQTTVYYVDPNREVTLQAPQTNAETGYKFKEWDQDTTKAKKYGKDTTVKGSFEKLKDIIPAEENGTPNAKPEGYVTLTFDKGDHGKEITGQTVYYVNPKADPAKTLGDKSIVKPTVKAEIGYKFTGWDTEDNFEIKDNKTVKAKYDPIADVVPKDNPQGGENEKPDGYITVTFSTETNGKIKGTTNTKTKVVYVNPNKAVVLKGQDPEVTPNTGFDFADWDTQIGKKIQYSDGDTIKALYNAKGDVIPQENPNGSDKPAGYLTVTFDNGDHGTLSGKTVYYVKPNTEVTVPAPTVTPATGYEFDKWDKELKQTFTKDTKITAQYKERDSIIPQEKPDGSDKPNGYITVTFLKGAHGELSEQTVYYVNPKAGKTLADITKPAVTPETGFKANGWDKKDTEQITGTQDITVTAQYEELDNVIPENNDDGTKNDKPDGYVTVKLIPTAKATDETKAEKIYFVNPTKKVTITNKPVGKKEKVGEIEYTYNFNGWKATIGTIASWKDEHIKGTFIQNTEIIAQYTTKVEPEALVPAPVPKKDVVTPINDVPKPEELIKNVPGSETDPLPEGTKITYTDDGTPDVKNPGDTTAKVKIEYPGGKTVVVEVPIAVVDNVVPQTGKDKPKVPANYVKVTVKTTDKATENTKFTKVFWVKPNVEVTIPGILAPTGKPETVGGVTKTNIFDKWQRQGTPAKSYDKEIKDTFTGDTTIVATYTVKDNVPPVGKDNPWIPQNSKPSPKDFIENPYDDNDPDNPNNLPPGTKFEFVPGTEPNTSESGEGKTTTIKVIYPNGETKEVPVTFRVTGDVVEQPDPNDPNTKPAVPDNFVQVTVDPTNQAKYPTKRVFWVNPEKIVTIPADNPTAKDANKRFTGWDSSLTQQFKNDTTIKAQYGNKPADPRPTTDYVVTELGVQPTPKDYEKAITPPAGKRIRDVEIVERPNVDKSGKTSATIKVIYEDGSMDQITVPVFVQKKDAPTPDLRPYPIPGDGGNSGNQPNVPNQPNQPNVGKDALNTTDHYQYLIGYPDGNFAPNKGMTRAEAATMFTRLLNERPVKWRHYDAGLSDIRPGDWYANTVGYAVQRGIVSGYPDGSFKPNKPITRAEFAAIASRFDALAQGNAISFSDLAPSHWGYNAIRSAATKGWISGYPDNTFRPEQAITRAEVTAITNRMLNRHADLYWIDAHPSEVIRFGDVKRSDWYFEPIMEATMGHDFIRDRDKKTEHWTGINGKSFI